MIVDIHTHTFPDRIAKAAMQKLTIGGHVMPYGDGTRAGLIKTSAEAGVDVSIIQPVATAPRQVEHINDRAMEANETQAGSGLLSFGAMHPDYEAYRKELARLKEHGIQGIKLHPIYQETDLDDLRFLRILDRCGELGLAVLCHTGFDVGYPGIQHCSPRMIRTAMNTVGPMTFIAAHMGGWRCWDQVEKELSDTGVYLDTAYALDRMIPLDHTWDGNTALLSREEFMYLFKIFGPKRILFGSDSPWSSPLSGIRFLESLPISSEDRQLILGGNASRLFDLSGAVSAGERQPCLHQKTEV